MVRSQQRSGGSAFDPSYQNLSVEGRIVAALERISQAFRVLLWNEGKEFSLSPIQVQILIFLLHHDESKRKISFLADEFNMTRATVSDSVKSLAEKLLLTRVQDERDTRSHSLHLTEKGREIAQKASMFAAELSVPVTKLSENQKTDFLLNLVEIIDHLNKAGIITPQRMCTNCLHYEKTTQGEHFCKLINSALQPAELRIDCPEHQMR